MISDTTLSRHWRIFVYVLNICRFSLIVLLAGTVLLNVGQGEDLLLTTAEDRRYALLLSSCLLWAFSIWLWTRTLLDIKFPSTPQDLVLLAKYRLWTPRVLGVLPFVVVAASAFAVGGAAIRFVLPTLAVGIVFALLVVFRRTMGRAGARLITRRQPKQNLLWVDDMKSKAPSYKNLWNAYSQFLGKTAFLLLAVGLSLFAWGLVDPLSMGARFNALALIMVWGATILPIGSLITYWANMTRLPLISALILLALIFSFWNDNHAIRPFYAQDPLTRLSVDEALDAWADKNCKAQECGPLVVVATAGGGIRAAYWTGVVLGHLKDTVPTFHDRLFAISGVSGGSVGAAVYRGVATGTANNCDGKVLECSTRVLSRDYISPLSASLLYRDLIQRFLPLALLPDRAETLEKAWERGFEAVTNRSSLANSFSALGADSKSAWPALFLNATWSNNGRRIVAATVNIADDKNFKLSNDQLATIGYDIRVSTAAHNSARFPYVSPPGSWHAGKGDDKTRGKIRGRLQDGGLFENYGAETALEILNAAQKKFAHKPVAPLVILISSDPTLPEDLAPSPRGRVGNFAYELLTTIRTTARTRVGHGSEAATRLKDWAMTHGKFAYFRMCDPTREEADPPLGWALSQQAQKTIQSYLLESFVPGGMPLSAPSCRTENRNSARQVCELLSQGVASAVNCGF